MRRAVDVIRLLPNVMMMQRSYFFGFALLLSGCVSNPASAQEPAVKPSLAAPAADDRSLTLEEAEGLKFPSLDRPWKGSDYKDVVQTLSRIGTADAARLPRPGSARSGELFAKLTTTAHFASFNDPAVDVKTRVPDALEQLQSLNRLGEVYSSAAERKFIEPAAYLDVYATTMHAARRVLLGLDEYVASLDESDPNAPFRKEGINKLKDAVTDMVETAVSTLANEKLSEADRRRLIESVRPALPEAIGRLAEPRRQQLLLRFKFIATNAEPQELRPALQSLVEATVQAIATAVPPTSEPAKPSSPN